MGLKDFAKKLDFPDSKSICLRCLWRPRKFIGLLNSIVIDHLKSAINASLISYAIGNGVEEMISIAKWDWNASETSWDFERLLYTNLDCLKSSWQEWESLSRKNILKMKSLEEVNNLIFINTYGLNDELIPTVREEQ
jgi:hypothetical protein